MRSARIVLAAAAVLVLAVEVAASPRCHAALADWKPREDLEVKLKAEGWQFHRIRIDDGCYKVYGRRADGKRVKAAFAPDTLVLIRETVVDD